MTIPYPLQALQGVFFGRPEVHVHVFQVVESVEDLLASVVHIKPLQVGPAFRPPEEGFLVTTEMRCVCFAV